jgi:hypothetical protein
MSRVLGFMSKEPLDIKTESSDIKIDAPIKELIEVIKATEFICVNQLKKLESHLASASNYIGYSDLIELELHKEHGEEFHLEILEEIEDESLVDQEEFEFEVVEYPDNSNPHPPPEEPISSEKIFDNLDENSEVVSLTVPLPTSQPSDDSIQDNGNMEDNFSLQIPDHYEQWLAFHHDSHMHKFIKILQGLPNFKVWLNKERHMFLGWSILKKNSKLIKLGKGSSTSHPGQGFFRHLRSYFIHDMVGPNSFHLSHLDGEPSSYFSNDEPFGVQRGTLCNVSLTFLL